MYFAARGMAFHNVWPEAIVVYMQGLNTPGRLTDPAEFEKIILKSGSEGSLVQLRDVGRAELGAENYSSNLRFNGYDAVGIGLTQLPNANALEVDRDAKAELARLSQKFPPGLKYNVAFDTTTTVAESINRILRR